MLKNKKGWDYIVIGGGSAGCVLANRLSKDSNVNVLLLEAGPMDNNPYIHMPIGFAKMTTGPYTWGFNSSPLKNCNDRVIPLAQGFVIGGGSSINAMVATRGNPLDYDRWANEEGCEGWSFKEIQKYFIRSENNDRLSGPMHGTSGPQVISDLVNPMELSKIFVKSAQEYGLKYNGDFNGETQEGTGIYQTYTHNAKRCSAADAYLKPVLNRNNLSLRTNCLIQKVIIENKKAVGIEISHKGKNEKVMANREIILSAGAINSPKLLLLSGIGPSDHLQLHNIDIVNDLPGVGENLQDHFDIDIVYELNGPYSLDKYNKWHWMIWAGLQYLLFKTGPVTSNAVEGGAFSFSNSNDVSPDLQFHFLPAAGVEPGLPPIKSGNGCTLNSYFLRPRSRGTVKLQSNMPTAPPIIDPNYIYDDYDLERSIDGVIQSRDIMSQASFKPFIKKEHFPGPDVKTKKDVEEYARQYGRTSYHHVGTCKMGSDDMSVVDANLKVYGIEGLRVIDSSIMPSLISSNTYAPTLMIAEKGADIILNEN